MPYNVLFTNKQTKTKPNQVFKMEEKIKQLVQQYNKGGFTQSELEWELLNLYAVSRRSELLSAFSWVSSIGEQFFDSSKTVDDMVDIYQKNR